MNAPVVEPGEVLAGKYRVERVLGQGGMGVVVSARHLQLDEMVAVKFLLSGAAQPDQVARFLREGRAAVKIKSEHVARVSDVGTLDDGAPYMVMEYLQGCDLAELLKKEGKLPISEAVEFVLHACEALAEAHTMGIIHRDLKPANLFLVERADGSPCVKVLDFGISKLKDAGVDGHLTIGGGMMGSPSYMSPEQLSNPSGVDVRADLWAMGVILYELVAGVRPFVAESLPQLIMKLAMEEHTPLKEVLPEAPDGFVAVIDRCLQKDKDGRYADVGELARALLPFAPPECQISIDRISRVLAADNPGRRPAVVHGSKFDSSAALGVISLPEEAADKQVAADRTLPVISSKPVVSPPLKMPPVDAQGSTLTTTAASNVTLESAKPPEIKERAKAKEKEGEPQGRYTLTPASKRSSSMPLVLAIIGAGGIVAVSIWLSRGKPQAQPPTAAGPSVPAQTITPPPVASASASASASVAPVTPSASASVLQPPK